MTDIIIKTLNEKEGLFAWQIRRIKNLSNQLYLIGHNIESRRTVDIEKFVITVFVERESSGKKILGESEFLFIRGENLKSKIDTAVSMAALVENEPFMLPESGLNYVVLETVDKDIKENPDIVVERITDDIFKAISMEKGIHLSAAEIYVNLYNIAVINSRGVKVERDESDIYVEFVLMAGREGHDEVESGTAKRARFYNNLQIDKVIKEYAKYANDSLIAKLPPTGQCDVVFSGEALDTLFNWFITQASGAASYQGWSLFEKGKPVIDNPEGMNLTLISNPSMEGGMMTRPFDNQGLPLKSVEVIKNGVFQARMASKRYADYLGIPAIGDFANVEIPQGPISADEIFHDASIIIHLCRFSTFEPNGVTGSFSGEIRSGWLVNDGKTIPVKGGAVTGSMQKAFKKVYFSKEMVQRESYKGPAYIKICGLDIGGE
ncbi:hypothetical protein HZA55_05840 [Candidatus Poribacteria bacterium]|nr:hypothetical protein [Candidatus Poribacteria bacterium]